MSAQQKCLGKWEKKLTRINKLLANPVYGHLLREEKSQKPIVEEAIKDLKRFIISEK